MSYAAERGLANLLTTPPPPETPGKTEQVRAKKRAQALRLIISTLTPDSLARLGDSILDEEPRVMLIRIQEYYYAEQSPAVQESLRVRAEVMRMKLRESLDDYFDRHLLLRGEMMQSGYPLIDRETTTVSFIVRGLV